MKNTKDGYVWVGHHNKNQAQCFSNAEFCNVAVTQEKSGVEIDFALNSSSTYEIFAKPLWDTENGRLEISKGVLLQAHGREEHDSHVDSGIELHSSSGTGSGSRPTEFSKFLINRPGRPRHLEIININN